MPTITIVGVGNTLLQDDGAGIHALGLFGDSNDDPDVRCLDAGTVGLAVMDRLLGIKGLVAIDALRTGRPPGTVTVLEGEAMDTFLRHRRGSAHEVGLSDLLDALRLSGDLPPRRALVGIEPAVIEWGTEVSMEIAHAIPLAAESVARLVDRWQREFADRAVA